GIANAAVVAAASGRRGPPDGAQLASPVRLEIAVCVFFARARCSIQLARPTVGPGEARGTVRLSDPVHIPKRSIAGNEPGKLPVRTEVRRRIPALGVATDATGARCTAYQRPARATGARCE